MNLERVNAALANVMNTPAWAWGISGVRATFWLILGYGVARVSRRLVLKVFSADPRTQTGMLVGRGVYYGVLTLTLISVLKELGFDLSVLLGAAGVFSVAVGFASQTSTSNFISGLFLIAEQPFQLGDVVRIGTTTGEVLAIDALSIKLRTLDNLFVRVPNEIVIKSEVANLSRFPIRRLDVSIGVPYAEDLKRVERVLLELAYGEIHCLAEPAAQVIVIAFANSAVNLELRVWVERSRYLEVKTALMQRIKSRFDEQGIKFPFP